jgi:hypothetical protein
VPEQPNGRAPVARTPRDLLGWACLLVVVPPLWLAAPLVLAFTVVRLWRSQEAGGPTVAASFISFLLSCFWIYYVAAVLGGAHP